MVELTRLQQQLVHAIVCRRFPGRDVKAFGSRARGSSKPWSDLDLVILGSDPVSDLAVAQARVDFEESDLPFRVDLSLWTELPDTIRQDIERHGVRL